MRSYLRFRILLLRNFHNGAVLVIFKDPFKIETFIYLFFQRNWQSQYDFCRVNNGGMDLLSLESNEEERAIHAAWTTST